MRFSQIRPYVRYARTLTLKKTTNYPVSIPYDARLFYVQQGEGLINVSDHQFKMKKGSALIINSGIEYTIKAPEKSVKYIVFNFDFVDDNSNISELIVPATQTTYDRSKLISHIEFDNGKESALNTFLYIENAELIEKKAILLVSEYKKKLSEHQLMIKCLMSEILIDIIRIESMPTLSKEGVARQILEYIEEHYNTPLTNKSLAAHFGYHPNYLSALIKKAVGTPLHQYLVHIRLLRAMEMLESGELNIGEISEQVGFCDTHHFSHYFKKVMNMSPSEYAKNSI